MITMHSHYFLLVGTQAEFELPMPVPGATPMACHLEALVQPAARGRPRKHLVTKRLCRPRELVLISFCMHAACDFVKEVGGPLLPKGPSRIIYCLTPHLMACFHITLQLFMCALLRSQTSSMLTVRSRETTIIFCPRA